MDMAAHHRPFRMFRLLILLMVVFGVSGMHTLGHPEAGHVHGDVVAMQAHMPGGGPQTMPHAATDAGSAGSSLPDLDPSATCLAVLTSFLMVLLAGLGVRSRRWCGAVARTGVWVWCVPRPPPRRISLDLTRVAVLRI